MILLSEIKRVFREKKFIHTYLFLMSIFFLLLFFMYLAIYISGAVIDGLTFWKNFMSIRFLTTFFSLFPVLVYCGSFGDDVENRYITHILLKIGFKKYFINKYLATVISGGLLYFILSLSTFYLSWAIFKIDISSENFKNALSIKLYKSYLFSGDISVLKLIEYSIVVSFIIFALGVIYSSIGFLMSLFTNNKMLIYGTSVLSLRLYEQTLYTYAPILSKFFSLSSDKFYSKYSLFEYLGYYSDIKILYNSIIIFFLVSFVIIIRYNKLKKIYNES